MKGERIDARQQPTDRAWFGRSLAAARAGLADAPFAAAWESGSKLSLEQATDEALSVLEAPSVEPSAGAHRGRLSEREIEVVLLIVEGLTNRRIAERLVVAERTVHAHVRNILDKLGLQSRAQVAAWAVREGLVARSVD